MKDAPSKPFVVPLSGRWKPAFPGVQLASGDFRILTNMRYTEKSIQAVKGMSKISLVALNNEGAPAIGYTTQQMPTSGTQEFTVTGGTGPYTWSIPSGGGSLDPTTGTTVTYTAPSTNPNCTNNPTIRVTDALSQTAEVQLAINAWSGSDVATANCFGVLISGNCTYYSYYQTLDCNGEILSTDYCASCTCDHVNCDPCLSGGQSCTAAYVVGACSGCMGQPAGTVLDKRTAPMISGGCCPVTLL
jgi:hypothetical protein